MQRQPCASLDLAALFLVPLHIERKAAALQMSAGIMHPLSGLTAPDQRSTACKAIEAREALQVLLVSDPKLLPVMFDRSLYPPNANVLDRPVDEFLHLIDAVRRLYELHLPSCQDSVKLQSVKLEDSVPCKSY